MSNKIYVNLPVSDLAKSIAFYQAVGYSINEKWTDETAACVVISEDIHAMLLTHARFSDFTPNEICNARQQTEVLLALGCESRDEVDELVRKAVAAGGNTYNEPQDHGFMYGHGYQDPDGHIWEVFYMDPAAVEST
ncbi:VOC family protein [Gimesia sp.]|uniref:VOC family protein n=1 Tax=Gimesia sp. TaxID=2024833 RepID=UPI0032F00A53